MTTPITPIRLPLELKERVKATLAEDDNLSQLIIRLLTRYTNLNQKP